MRVVVALLLAGLITVLGACTPGNASPTPSTLASAAPSSLPTSPTPAPGSITPEATHPGQTDTAWGRIWDGLPYWFPVPALAEPTQTGSGPASAVLDVTAYGTATEQADVLSLALVSLGFDVTVDGPLESGAFTIDATRSSGCAAQVTLEPLGGTLTMTVFLGAACPFP